MVLRARTVLLVRDVLLHIGLLQKPGLYTFPKISPSFVLTQALDLSQKEWLVDAVNLMSRLTDILQVLDNAVNRSNDPESRILPDGILREGHETRQTYLLLSSCKLFCMTAQAQIYMETSKLPIVPKDQKGRFRDMARDSMQAFFLIYKTFDQEDDLLHLDYFTIVSRGYDFPPLLEVSMSLTIVQMCWHKIRALYLVLYPGDLSWYPYTEVSRQVILLESTLRVTPAGKNVSVMHSMTNLVNTARSPGEPNYLKEDDRIKAGL